MATIANLTSTSASVEPTLLTSISVAVGIFLIGLVVGRVVGKLVGRLLMSISLDKVVTKKHTANFTLQSLVGGMVSTAIYIAFAIVALNYVGLTHAIVTILAIIALLVLAISAVLALRDSLPNMLAYGKIVRYNMIVPGDLVKLSKVGGKVVSINLFEVAIETKVGDIVHIPNVLFIREQVKVKKRSKEQ